MDLPKLPRLQEWITSLLVCQSYPRLTHFTLVCLLYQAFSSYIQQYPSVSFHRPICKHVIRGRLLYRIHSNSVGFSFAHPPIHRFTFLQASFADHFRSPQVMELIKQQVTQKFRWCQWSTHTKQYCGSRLSEHFKVSLWSKLGDRDQSFYS
jgi:hypothetical protein